MVFFVKASMNLRWAFFVGLSWVVWLVDLSCDLNREAVVDLHDVILTATDLFS